MTQILLINQNVKAMIRMRLKLNCLNCNILYLLQNNYSNFQIILSQKKKVRVFQHTVLSWIKFYDFPQFLKILISVQFSRVWLFVTSWNAAWQTSLSITNSRSLLKFMSIELMMPSNHLVLCHPLPLPCSILPSFSVFSKELVLHIRWPKY